MKPMIGTAFATALLTGCTLYTLDHGAEPTLTRYTEPRKSGLVAVRPYPNPDDVCEVIGENALTAELLDDSHILIGCPKHEKGAISDRKREGATVVAHAEHWTLLQVSSR